MVPMKLISPSMHPLSIITTNSTSNPPRSTTSNEINLPPTSTIIKDATSLPVSDIVISPLVKNCPTPPSTTTIIKGSTSQVKNSCTSNCSSSYPPRADSLVFGSMSGIIPTPLTNSISQSSTTAVTSALLSDLPVAPVLVTAEDCHVEP